MATPLISIITINLNNAAGLQRILTSVQQQQWQQYELVVVDGGSTDDSKNVWEFFRTSFRIASAKKMRKFTMP